MLHKGIQLPLVNVTVSVVGFYLLSPLIVLVGHLVTLRRLPQTFSTLSSAKPQFRHERLSVSSDCFMFISLLLAGPITLLLITYRFAAYQSPFLFLVQAVLLIYACYATAVRYLEIVKKVTRSIKCAAFLVAAVLLAWLILAADVILLPAQYSATLWLKTNTVLLDSEDGGTVAWVPHIRIDRATSLWTGAAKGDDDLAMYTGHLDAKELFMTRLVTLDLRSRNLRFLDINHQVIPRVWAHDADLSGANLSFTRLYGSIFVGTRLSGASFEVAALDGSTFMNITIDDTVFVNTQLKCTFWDTVTLNDSAFLNADLSLASFYGVNLNHVIVEGTNFTATTLFQTTATETSIGYTKPNKILSATGTDTLIKDTVPVFEVAPEAAFAEIAKQLCIPNIAVGWEYAWTTFRQIKVIEGIGSRTEPKVVSALQELFELEECKGLPDHGLR